MNKTTSIWLPRYEEPTEESKAALREVMEQSVSQQGAEIARDFLNITRQQGDDVEFMWLGMQIYVAGKLAGIRAERERRKAGKEKATQQLCRNCV